MRRLQPQLAPTTPAPPSSPSRVFYETPQTPEAEARRPQCDAVLTLSPASLQRLDKDELIGLISTLRASVHPSAPIEAQQQHAKPSCAQRVTPLHQHVPGGLEVRIQAHERVAPLCHTAALVAHIESRSRRMSTRASLLQSLPRPPSGTPREHRELTARPPSRGKTVPPPDEYLVRVMAGAQRPLGSAAL